MKNVTGIKIAFAVIIMMLSAQLHAQNPVNWTPNQLIEPSALARSIEAKKDVPVILSVGPGSVIPQSINIGMASEKEGLEKLKAQLKNTPKDENIVIYCGCCPFDHCPNVRPAIDVLKEMKFTNYHLLNLPDNIKKNWIEKGYPVAPGNK